MGKEVWGAVSLPVQFSVGLRSGGNTFLVDTRVVTIGNHFSHNMKVNGVCRTFQGSPER